MRFLSLLLLLVALQDPAKDLKSKDVQKRLAAVDALGADEKGEKALLGVLKDKREDWEVQVEAAKVLAQHGSAAATDELVKQAYDAPIRMLRLAAARTLGKLAPKAGAEALLKKANGDSAFAALESLEALLGETQEPLELKGLEKLIEKAKEPAVRAAAARVLVHSHRADRAAVLAKLLASGSIAQRCAALEVCCADPRADCADALAAFLGKPGISDLSERRGERALAAALGAAPAAGLDVLRPLASAKDGAVSARAARCIEQLPSAFAGTLRLASLAPCFEHKDAGARAAAAHALVVLAAQGAARARGLFEGDREARVRLAALESWAALAPEADEDFGKSLCARLPVEDDATVRERIAVHLGRKGLLAAVEPLSRALEDAQWGVAVCAAVSLGQTQTGPAVERLTRLLRESKDWKLRGAAAAGLGQSYVMACLVPLAEALSDPDKSVAATAQAYLVSLTLQPLPPKPEAWKDWLSKNASKLELHDPKSRDAIAQRERERGTFVDSRARDLELTRVFKDLALFVLDSRGDHIQTSLARLEIQHTLVQAGKVNEFALQPDALFVANCTGEIEAQDVERLAWFVRAGGHLFGSCWALTETIDRIAPGVIHKAETASEVLDHVPAMPADATSPFLEGVFGRDVQPIYELEGAHLIEVQDPERAHVLVDSPLCAEHWGSGNLAAWFPVGHGLILDSVNHFEAQGLELAEGLKTREDRQAYALDHMGLAWADLRATKDEKFWDNSLRASEKIADLSVFRLVTNFVERWRIEVGR
ncbi:MAG: HEAT repeat domain-containing protein [Planctomycetes bacterium]|nr:HEAT repeat domain-containing protein [Planctomycetota bacterium]